VVAGAFTDNAAAAAPVRISREHAQKGCARGVVINAGCANAMTGERGLHDARQMAQETAARLCVPPNEILVCSTGIVGTFLPMALVRNGIIDATATLRFDDLSAAQAIMTTDGYPKRAAVRHDDGWTVGGIAKGTVNMAPRLATTLVVLTTDARTTPMNLKAALAEAIAPTLNSITIDGETSTNDTALIFANGASGVEPVPSELTAAITAVCRALAHAIVADARGATKLVRISVTNAADPLQARAAARVIAESMLVKCALNGCEPDWGRVAAAVGQAKVNARFDHLSIAMGGSTVLNHGIPADAKTLARAHSGLTERMVHVSVDLAAGNDGAEMLTADLSQDYVRLAAEPASAAWSAKPTLQQ
jgi:glutamate N-acetyltransferase/amino-acid N-acetyltransferase